MKCGLEVIRNSMFKPTPAKGFLNSLRSESNSTTGSKSPNPQALMHSAQLRDVGLCITILYGYVGMLWALYRVNWELPSRVRVYIIAITEKRIEITIKALRSTAPFGRPYLLAGLCGGLHYL